MVRPPKSSESARLPGLEVVPAKAFQVVQSGGEADSMKDIEAFWSKLYEASHPSVDIKSIEALFDKDGCEDDKNTGRVCGLRLRTFWVVLVAGSITIAAIVGAGIVGSLLRKQVVASSVASLNSTTSRLADLSRLPKSSATSAPRTRMAVDHPTPSITATATESTPRPRPTSIPIRTTATGASTSLTPFPNLDDLELDCPHLDSKHYISKASAFSPHDFQIYCSVDYNTAPDMGNFNTTSLQDCIDLCSLVGSNDPNLPCRGVGFNSNVTHALEVGASCFLKSDVTTPNVRGDLPPNSYAGAVLIS